MSVSTWSVTLPRPCAPCSIKRLVIEGLDDFTGQVLHMADWPQDGVVLNGQRVA